MNRFQNVRTVASPPGGTSFQSYNSNTLIQTSNNTINNFKTSNVGGDSRLGMSNIGLARSGFFNPSILGESNVRGLGRGIGNLSEQRLRIIAKQFLKGYGSGTQIGAMGLNRMQRQAYENCSQKPQFNEQSQRQLQKTMDQNRDGRITEEDIMSLCRRYLSCDKRPINFTTVVEERLAVARRLFKQFDVQKKGYLTEKQVPHLLNETYKALGKSFTATEQDIKSWMKLTDGDGDGQVTLAEYERSIIRALKKQGIKIYDQ